MKGIARVALQRHCKPWCFSRLHHYTTVGQKRYWVMSGQFQKIKEAVLAIEIERKFTKDQISGCI